MCGIPCLSEKWEPVITPKYRPPRGGWTIRQMPDAFPDALRATWPQRRARGNRNASEAVEEMVKFLMFNNFEVTKEGARAIRAQADAEWCAAEPDRCPRGAKMQKASKSPLQPEVRIVSIAQKTPAPKKSPAPKTTRRSCCG